MIRRTCLVAAACFTIGVSSAAAQTAAVTGTVAYRERIALSPTAVVEVSLEDVSRADAPAIVIASRRIESPGNPPIRFDLEYDAARIDASHRYAVRARITDGGRLLFTTTTATLVVTQGHPNRVELMLSSAGGARQGGTPPAIVATPGRPEPPAPRLTGLPATFTGTLPCADCPGIRYHLNLFADDTFFLRTTYVDRPGGVVDDIGSFVLSSDRRVLVLKGSRDVPELFAIRDTTTLRKLDADAREIKSALPYDLRRAPRLQPIEVQLAMRGSYRYLADAGTFTECSTGQRWAVAAEGANRELEAGYLKVRKQPGDAVLVALEGRVVTRPGVDGGGPVPTLVPGKMTRAIPGESCPPRFASAPLEDTYWRLTRLGDAAVPPAKEPRHEPSLTFSAEPRTVSGSTGCNRLSGAYDINGGAIRFGTAGTLMACPGTNDTETAFKQALQNARGYRILGRILDLFDEAGRPLARFEARAQR